MTIFKRDLQTLLDDGALGTLSDGRLLERVVARNEAAFEELLRRHGAMVWGVCLRILRNAHDAEDAFQATFLVLARRAPSIAHRELIAHWLYRVACQTAMKARTMTARRRARERQVSELPEAEAIQPKTDDLGAVLDQELGRLPEKYRIPIVLCELEGKTHREAAQFLGWPIGTVSGRLSRGREMLAGRLRRRGLAVTGGALATLFSEQTASACPPAALLGAASPNVAALADGVLKAMLLSKLGVTTCVLLLVGALGVGLAGPLDTQAPATEAGQSPQVTAKPARAGAIADADEDELHGTWRLVSAIRDGKSVADRLANGLILSFQGTDRMTFRRGELSYENTFKSNAAGNPRTIDLAVIRAPWEDAFGPRSDRPRLGIYSLEGTTLSFCFAAPGGARPSEFRSDRGSDRLLTVYERIDDRAARVDMQGPDASTVPTLRLLIAEMTKLRDSTKEELKQLETDFLKVRLSGVGGPREQELQSRLAKERASFQTAVGVLKDLQLMLDRKQGQFAADRMILP